MEPDVGCPVLDYYGLSESYPLCGNYPTVEVRPGSMGLPLPGWEVAILDPDEQPVPQGEPGEICLRARSNPHYPLGYWNRPEDSKEVFGGDWFHTKDTARQDEDGYVWYSGRADDVIISAGYRIGPFEVESTLLEHPAVAESAVVASPDPQRGHVVKAFVVLAAGHRRATSWSASSSGTSASACRPTPTRARSSSSTTCPRPSPARSAARSCEREREGASAVLLAAGPAAAHHADDVALGVGEEADRQALHDVVRTHHARAAQALGLGQRRLDVGHLHVHRHVAVVALRPGGDAAADADAVLLVLASRVTIP